MTGDKEESTVKRRIISLASSFGILIFNKINGCMIFMCSFHVKLQSCLSDIKITDVCEYVTQKIIIIIFLY